MKQRQRVTVGVLSLLITVAAWLLVFWQEGILWSPAAEVIAEPAYIDLSPGTAADIIALSWEYDGSTVILSRDDTDGSWYDLEDRDCPVDSDLIDGLTETLAGVCAALEIEKPGDPAQYGLDEPFLTLLAATEDRMVTYELGNMTLNGETYLRLDKGDTVFVETGVLAAAFSLRLEDLLGTEALPAADNSVTSMTVETGTGSYSLTLCTDPPEGWYGTGVGWFYRSDDTLLPLDTDAAEQFCADIAALSLSACVAWEEADMEALGLSDPQASAALTFADGERLLLDFGNWEAGSVFVRSGSSGYAYRTDSTVLDTLLHPDLLSLQSHSVCPLDWSLVTGAELTLPEGTVSIECRREVPADDPSGEPEVYVLANGWTVEPDRVQMWLSRLEALTGDPSGQAVPEDTQPLMSLCFARDDNTVTLDFYPYDSTCYLCRMGDRVFLTEQTTPDSLLLDAAEFLIST